MTTAEREKVVVQEYPAEMAGELVAWMNIRTIEETESRPERKVASFAIAQIGNEGAQLSFIKGDDGELLQSSDTNIGFIGSTELYVVTDGAGGTHFQAERMPSSPYFSRNERNTEGIGLNLYGDNSILPEKGEWVVGGLEIVRALKRHLEAADISFAYEKIYYSLPIMSEEYMLLGDPSMGARTATLLDGAGEQVKGLSDIVAEDTAMKTNLTIFGSLPAEEIPDAFIRSRLRVAELESDLKRKRSQMPIGDWYMPIGARPAGRTWPYMDPEAADEERAFGIELKELREKNPYCANRELGREIDELGLRLNRARDIAYRIGLLARKEKEEAVV